MGAIAGIFDTSGRNADAGRVGQMIFSMKHRGTEGSGVWMDGCVTLSESRLGVIADLGPKSECGIFALYQGRDALSICLDGRIDNRDELISRLKKRGLYVSTGTDAEIALQAYRAWGIDCLSHIIGVFALAIWESKTRQLFCARDVVGLRPFFYTWDGTRFSFASEIGPLVESTLTTPELDEDYIAAYLTNQGYDRENTIYRGVHRLVEAHYLLVSEKGISCGTYWNLPKKTIEYACEEDYVDHFREIFEAAVACRLRSDGPVGVMMSGGLDSSSVASMAGRLREKDGKYDTPLRVYSNVFEGESRCDEREYSQTVVDAYGLEARFIPSDDFWFFKGLSDLRGVQDEPYHGPMSNCMQQLIVRARTDGTRVLLHGHGGDHIISGASFYLVEEVRSLNVSRSLGIARKWSRDSPHNWYAILVRHGIFPLLPNFLKELISCGYAMFTGKQLRVVNDLTPRWLEKEFKKRVFQLSYANRLRQSCRSIAEHHNVMLTHPEIRSSLWLDQYLALPEGVEVRYPYLDRRLIEFVMSVPPHLLFDKGTTKVLLRKAMQGILPDKVRNRSNKTIFNPLLVKGLHEEWEEITRLLEETQGQIDRFVDIPRLKEAMTKAVSGGGDISFMRAIFLALCLDKGHGVPGLRAGYRHRTESIL